MTIAPAWRQGYAMGRTIVGPPRLDGPVRLCRLRMHTVCPQRRETSIRAKNEHDRGACASGSHKRHVGGFALIASFAPVFSATRAWVLPPMA